MNESNPTVFTKKSLQESRASGSIPIIAGSIVQESLTSHPVTEKEIIEEFLESAKECGFNMGSIYGNPSTLVSFFSNFHEEAYNRGLKLFLGSPIFSQSKPFAQNQSSINKLKQDIAAIDVHNVLAGWDAISDPQYANLANVRKYYECLKDYSDSIEVLVSLIGGVHELFTGPITTYKTYLEYILGIIPGLTPLFANHQFIETNAGKYIARTTWFYDFLLAMLEVSNSQGIPFWSYCHCMQLYTVWSEQNTADGTTYNTHSSRPSATLETMRYEIFTALAYGSKGIEFYDYSRRSNHSRDYFGQALAEIQMNGTEKSVYKSPEWYAAQQVISEIKQFQTVFNNGIVVSLWHYGINIIPTKIYQNPHINAVPIDNIISVRITTEEGVVVSRIQSSGYSKRDWLVIVNKSPFAPQRVTLTFNQSLVKEKSITKSFIVADKNHECFFYPGETSCILDESSSTNIEDGAPVTRLSQTRQLYPGAYIIFQLLTPLT